MPAQGLKTGSLVFVRKEYYIAQKKKHNLAAVAQGSDEVVSVTSDTTLIQEDDRPKRLSRVRVKGAPSPPVALDREVILNHKSALASHTPEAKSLCQTMRLVADKRRAPRTQYKARLIELQNKLAKQPQSLQRSFKSSARSFSKLTVEILEMGLSFESVPFSLKYRMDEKREKEKLVQFWLAAPQ